MAPSSPQVTIDDFWSKFNSKSPAMTLLPLSIVAQKSASLSSTTPPSTTPIHTTYALASSQCRTKVQKIARDCRRNNQKYRDPHFDIEFDLKWHRRDCLATLPCPTRPVTAFAPKSAKRVGDIFDSPRFFGEGGPREKDVRQGRDGDCWLMAALCTMSGKAGLIERVCVARDEEVGVYGFVFFRDGEWISCIIDDKLYLTRPDYDESVAERVLWEDRERGEDLEEGYRRIYQTGSGALYFAQCEGSNETWLPLLEKAYAKVHGDYAAIEGGFTGEGIEDLTGGVTTELFATDILDKERFWKNELLKVNDEFMFGCAAGVFKGWGERKGIKESHAYSITRAVEIDGHRLLLLKNPWGKGEWTGAWSDGSEQWTPEWMAKLNHRFGNDGAFWISYEDLLSKYQTFDRTRLFTDEWKVSQRWVNVNVPWVVGYLDTRFSFELSKQTSVVLVLSQLDSRYWRGLEGQYSFELSFRLHKVGEDDYIVRSHANYCMSRSVSAELDLDEGEYHVLIKIAAERNTSALPVETVIRDNCRTRRDKLMRRGLAYDLAHAKGVVVESEAEKRGREMVKERGEIMHRVKIKNKLTNEKIKKMQDAQKKKKKAKSKEAKKACKTLGLAARKKKIAPIPENPTEQGPIVSTPSQTIPPTARNTKDGDNGIINRSGAVSPMSLLQSNVESSKLANINYECPHFTTTATTTRIKTAGPSLEALSSTSEIESLRDSISSISSNAVDVEIAATVPVPPLTPDSCVHADEGHECTIKEQDEFEKDPWNAVVVVGLRVHTKRVDDDREVTVSILRPGWDDWETKLDVDDEAIDAMRHGSLCLESGRKSCMSGGFQFGIEQGSREILTT